MKIKNAVSLLINAVVAISLCGFVLSCGGGGGDSDSGSAPGKSGSITLSTGATSLPADNSSSTTITATITDGNGSPVRHYTDVTFTTTLGRFRNGSTTYKVQTQPPTGADGFPNPDASPTGRAEAALIAGLTSGSAKVTVSSNGVTNSIYVSLTGVSGAIVLTASPATISADGSSSSIITATLTDSGGNPVTPGTPVSFKTGLGYFQNDSKTYSLTTPDSTGVVQVSLHAGFVPGTTYVVATSNNITQSLSFIMSNADASQISISAKPVYIEADGVSTSLVTATVASLSGEPIKDVPVTFYLIGRSTSTLPPGNTYTGTGKDVTTPFYSSGGITKFTMSHTGESNFIVWLWNDQTGDKVLLENVIGPVTGDIVPENLDAGNYFLEVDADGTWSIKVDGDIGPGISSGEEMVLAIGKTDMYGNVQYPYTSTKTPGIVMIKAETGEVSKSAEALSKTVEITQTDGPPAPVNLTPQDSEINANGQTETTIEAFVLDGQGNIVPDGTVVSFSATAGTLRNVSTTSVALNTVTTGTINGVASVVLTSVASATTLQSVVTATVGTNSSSVTVTFTGVSLTNMQATPAAIFANGTDKSTLTVRLEDSSGVAIVGETIVFSTTRGTIATAAASTNAEGVAETELTAPTTTGTATVTAAYGSITMTTTVSFEASDVGSITLVANPITIPADGTSSSAITATVTYSSGVAVPKGTSVTFTTNLGTFSNRTQTDTVITPTETGVVSVSLVSATTPGSAKVTATAINASQTVYVGMGGAPISITLAANPEGIPADGSSSSTITATLTDAAGQPVTPGTSVTFSTNLGTFSGGGTTIVATTQDATGVVSVSLISATTAGSATVTATSGGVQQSVTVTFSGSVVGSITLTANPNTLPADGTSTSLIRADVKDAQGNPVPDGESISFVVMTGTGTLSASSSATVGGFAEVTYTASKIGGTETIRAMSGNNVSNTVDITLTGSTVGSVQVTADPTSISADGKSTSAITATVKTADNQVVPDVDVVFTTSRGAITSPHITDAAGKALATLTSDRYNDPSVLVTATSLGVSGTVLVSFTGLGLTVATDPASVLAGGSSTITATFKDASGNPINGATLTFSTDKGTLNPATPQITNASGQAAVTLTSTTSGTATVTVTGGGATKTATVNFTRYFFTLEPDPTTTTIRVGETSVITATLLDNGVARAGETVFFSSTLGTLNPFQAVTGVDGKTTSTLTAGTQSGIAVIDGTVTIATDTPPTELDADTRVVITGGIAAKVIFTADPDVISTSTGVSTLTATVYDVNDQPVPEQEVYFRINAGPGGGEFLSASVKITNDFGVATVTLTAGSLPSAYHGVVIEANTQADFGGSLALTTLTIAGPVANIGIGMDLHTLTPEGGDLTVDISAIATDVNGNPISDGTLVSFSVQAIEFDEDRSNDHVIDCWDSNKIVLSPCPAVGTPGFGWTWFSDDVNQDGEMYGCDNVTCSVGPMCTTEDVNHNGILDPGEDKNDNGVIDPIQGTTIDGSVATVGGLARAKLVYPQPQANNIKVQITAEAGGVTNFYETVLLCTETMVKQGTCGIGY